MREKTIVTLDAASLFVSWLAGAAVPFRLVALLVPSHQINFWWLGSAIALSIVGVVIATVRYADGWRFSENVGHLWSRLSLVGFGAILGVWGIWFS